MGSNNYKSSFLDYLRYFREFISHCFPSDPTWSTGDIPDLTGKVIIVTGGNAGIGFETAKALMKKNAKVYLACRSEAKALAAIESLEELCGDAGQAEYLKLDLASLKSIKIAAEEFLRHVYKSSVCAGC